MGRKSLAVNRGEGRACTLKCWVAISPRPGLSQSWWMVLGSMLASDVKISFGSKPSAPHLSASRDGRWCCGVKRWLKERKKKCYGGRKNVMEKLEEGGGGWSGLAERRVRWICILIQSLSNEGEPFSIAELGVAQAYAITDPDYVGLLQIKSHTCQAAAYCLCVLGICLTVEGGLLHFPLLVFFLPSLLLSYFLILLFCFKFYYFFSCSGSSLWRMGSSWLWEGWVVVCGILVPWPEIEPRSPAWEHRSYPLHQQGCPSHHCFSLQFSRSVSVMSDFATSWTAAHQASLFITNSWSLLTEHVHWVRDAIQPSHPLSSPSPPAFNLSQHQGLSKWVPFLLPIQFSSVNFVLVTIFWGMVGYLGEWNGKITFFSSRGNYHCLCTH